MHRVHYAGDWFVTGSAIAHALLEYAQALAHAETSATIEVPTRESDGSVGRSEVLIGPASQLSSHEEDTNGDEVVDDALVEQMNRETMRLRRYGVASPVAGSTLPVEPNTWDEYDDL